MAKGFDTLSHDILLYKLAFYGFDTASVDFLNHICLKEVSKLNATPKFQLLYQ